MKSLENVFKSLFQTLTVKISFVGVICFTAFTTFGQFAKPVQWTGTANVQILASGDLQKTNGTGWNNSGGYSIQSIPGGVDGYVEFTVVNTSHRVMVGLSSSSPNNNYQTIDYGGYADKTTFSVWESGSHRGNFGTLKAGDVIRVEKQGNYIVYKLNNVEKYRRTNISGSNTPLFLDAGLYDANTVLRNARIFTGNVGIGNVNNPTEKLHVKDGNIRVENSGNAGLILKGTGMYRGAYINLQSSSSSTATDYTITNMVYPAMGSGLRIGQTDKKHLAFMQGKIAIGTSANLQNDFNAADFSVRGASFTETQLISSNPSQAMPAGYLFAVQGDSKLDGKLNIGNATNMDGYMVVVNGKLGANEVKVDINAPWGDFVFDDTYELDNLDQLDEFIQKNKHLPSIPSAKEIEKSGVDLGELTRLQMIKIEELTLHLIQMNERVQKLEQTTKD